MKKIICALLALPLTLASIPTQASEIHLNNDSFDRPIQREIILAQRYYRRTQVKRLIIIAPRRNRVRRVRLYRVTPVYRPVRLYRVTPVYRPVRLYRVTPIRRYNRYGNQRVYVR
ncbi:hypothetical protein NIES4071_106040 (plasmid) [Calothrix sp. NIES-4071]|nr:hypothetical protein NIES4071_106040 [Calothrix sp. NIES-4071]BAZ65022.1 hypothetical protein NIES4105_107550 [Calothrix sp. NIES-4105]